MSIKPRYLAALLLTTTAPALAAEHVVTQKGKAFSAAEVEVSQGDTVVFKNDDDTSHNVFSTSATAKFNLGVQKPGTDSPQKFDEAGEIEVRCAIHPKMKIKVKVKAK